MLGRVTLRVANKNDKSFLNIFYDGNSFVVSIRNQANRAEHLLILLNMIYIHTAKIR